MNIERKKNEIVIRLSTKTDVQELQNMIDYLKYKENSTANEISQEIVDELSKKINTSIWKKIKLNRGL